VGGKPKNETLKTLMGRHGICGYSHVYVYVDGICGSVFSDPVGFGQSTGRK